MRKILFLLAALLGALPALAQNSYPRLSAAELEALDATAKQALQRIQMRSVGENLEYCGYIARTGPGTFRAEKPTQGDWAGCSLLIPHAERAQIVASYHTHSAYTTRADSEVPSVLDLTSDMEEEMIGYVATPGGRFWRSNAPKGTVQLLCGSGCLLMDPAFQEDFSWGKIYRSYTLEGLQQRQGDAGYER